MNMELDDLPPRYRAQTEQQLAARKRRPLGRPDIKPQHIPFSLFVLAFIEETGLFIPVSGRFYLRFPAAIRAAPGAEKHHSFRRRPPARLWVQEMLRRISCPTVR